MIFVILGVLAIFSLLVIAHEYGHYKTAKRNGVKVEEFGIGFPPKVWSITRGGTRYSINLFPIGGFVRLKGEDGIDKSKDSFASKSFWSKTKIVMAGVTVNFLIAYVIFTFLLWLGMPPVVQNLPSFGSVKPYTTEAAKLMVFSVGQNTAAQRAGLKQGDELLGINNQTFIDNEALKQFTKTNKGKEANISYVQNGKSKTAVVTMGNDEQNGILGVVVQPISYSRYSWWAAPIAALVLMVQLVWATIAAFGNLIVSLFTKAKVSDEVSGPIGVVSIFSQIVNFGWGFILLFVASISLSLAVINALPLPALDGGRELMLILRRVGMKITPQRENLIHILGFVALIVLMVVVSISDVVRMR